MIASFSSDLILTEIALELRWAGAGNRHSAVRSPIGWKTIGGRERGLLAGHGTKKYDVRIREVEAKIGCVTSGKLFRSMGTLSFPENGVSSRSGLARSGDPPEFLADPCRFRAARALFLVGWAWGPEAPSQSPRVRAPLLKGGRDFWSPPGSLLGPDGDGAGWSGAAA